VRRLLIVMLAAIAAFGLAGAPAAAQDGDDGATDAVIEIADPVDVLQVNGLFDDIVVAEIGNAIDRAEEQGSQALILQVDSRGAVVSDDVMADLLVTVDEAPVAIGIWVGPSGARLYGTPAQLLAVADVTGMAPGSRVGNVGPPVSDEVDLGPGLTALRHRTVGLSDARSLDVFEQRISDEGIATAGNMLDALDGYTEGEKKAIARQYLIPRQLEESGLDGEQIVIAGEALSRVISEHTREAGVRQLEREIGRLARKVARKQAQREGLLPMPARAKRR